MKKMHKIAALCLLLAAAPLSGCAGKSDAAAVDLNSLTVEQLEEGARKEGRVDSVGMPDYWANWKGTFDDLKELYGLDHTDIDISSAEEIAMFEAEKNSPTKDIGDVGQTMGPVAVEKGVTQPYKTSYWDEVPDWAKDEDGHWMIAYVGTTGFITNTELVENPPTSWKDIAEGDYKVTVGDVAKATQAQAAIISSALAFGGSIDNIQPGIDFWKRLAEEGRIDKGPTDIGRLQKGEISVNILWDYNVLSYRDAVLEANPNAKMQCNVPTDGAVQSGYTTIINKWAPHPHAAALTREYIFSDEGQINLARGYATPIRNVKLPDEVEAMRIPQEQYQNATPVTDFDAWEKAVQAVSTAWQDEIIPIIQ